MITKIQCGTKFPTQNVQRKNINQLNFTSKTTAPQILTDEVALNLLKKEFVKDMPESEANDWALKIKQICQKHNIKIASLPINEKYRGSLPEDEKNKLFTEIFYSIFSDSKTAKIELRSK